VAEVEPVREPRAVAGLGLRQAELREDPAQEREPGLRDPSESGRDQVIVRGRGERELDGIDGALVDLPEQVAQPLGGIADRLRRGDQIRRVLALPARERLLDQLPAVAEMPVEAPARRAQRLRESIDRNGADAPLRERVEGRPRPVVSRQEPSSGAGRPRSVQYCMVPPYTNVWRLPNRCERNKPVKIRNVHSRELPVASERLGALIDDLGGANDRLWPTDLWPATPLELDGPLAVGTPSRQGLLPQTQIRHTVAEYEPGKRLVFRFAPELGIVGTHRLEVKALGPEGTRLIHTLDCRLKPRMIPVYPMLIRQHNALVEDLLDRAELAATGAVTDPARWPVSVRIANAAEERIARRLGKLPQRDRPRRGLGQAWGVAVPAVLAALAALHAAWALGWRWPGGSDRGGAAIVARRVAAHRPRPADMGETALGS
jgi:hypothetical protein